MGSMSVTVSIADISVTGTITGGWDPDVFAAMGQRCVAAMVDAVEVLSLTVPRLAEAEQ